MEFHVAPMKNITNWRFRANCQGATDSYSEMIQLFEILKKKPRAMHQLDFREIYGQNQWIQVLTNNPKEMAKLPAILTEISQTDPKRSHFIGVNINLGCPDPHIISAGQGAALIKRRKRIVDMVEAFLTDTTHPYCINLKFRLGMHEQDIQMGVLVDVLNHLSVIEDDRYKPAIIHMKHAKQNSSEPARWEYVSHLLELDQPLILNGDLTCPKDLVKIITSLSPSIQAKFRVYVKGIMIGRALISNPRLFETFSTLSHDL